VQNSIQIEH